MRKTKLEHYISSGYDVIDYEGVNIVSKYYSPTLLKCITAIIDSGIITKLGRYGIICEKSSIKFYIEFNPISKLFIVLYVKEKEEQKIIEFLASDMFEIDKIDTKIKNSWSAIKLSKDVWLHFWVDKDWHLGVDGYDFIRLGNV